MQFLARRKFQQKIGISFALLITLIGINAIVAALATYSIANQTEHQKEIENIVRKIDQIRLTVSHFINTPDRTLVEDLFEQLENTRQRIIRSASKYDDLQLPHLISQINDFSSRFQKYVIETDQKAALRSNAVALGRSMMRQLNDARTDSSGHVNQPLLDTVIGHVLNVQWQGHELQSQQTLHTAVNMRDIQLQLEQLQQQLPEDVPIGMQRFLFRIIRDTRDYVDSFENYLRYQTITISTEQDLFRISAQIQADCDQISSELESTIRQHTRFATTIMLAIFIATLLSAIILARYLTKEILKPILKLVSITKKVASGQLDVTAEMDDHDDIGKLAHYFNLMTNSLRQSQSELLQKHHALEQAHDELEQRVAQRTQELAVANNALQEEIVIRQHSEAAIQSSEKKFRAMFELSSLGIARNSLHGDFLEANQAMLELLDCSLEHLLKQRFADFFNTEAVISWDDLQQELLQYGRYYHSEIRILSRSKRTITIRLNGVLVTDSDGNQSVWSVCEDITEQKKSAEIIWRQANFDMLTDLPNRHMFHSSLDHAIKNSGRNASVLALMFLDLDKFKEVNDTLGHDIGDMLLVQVAQRISHCIRTSDIVARLGGDEFTIILPNLHSLQDANTIARKITDSIAKPFILQDNAIHISTSIGITYCPNDATSPEELMSNADQAMYQAKAEGRNRFCCFSRSMQESSRKRLRLIQDLRDALPKNQFELYYQPIVDLHSGEIYKAEALLRWHHDTLGDISPAEFIPLAEETGIIVEIGDWVFRNAAHQVKHLRTNHHADFQISINKSPLQFQTDQSYTDNWFALLQQLGLFNQAIVIEITEGLLLDVTDNVKNRLLAYRDAGMQVSLDDFGTGYSSLAYLNRFDIDFLKIDQSFIRNLNHDSSELALCEAITSMAHRLGLKVVAEGVESTIQRDLLMQFGCDYTQGYLYSKPLPKLEFEAFLRSYESRLDYCSRDLRNHPSKQRNQ